jgi:hypothetical protein
MQNEANLHGIRMAAIAKIFWSSRARSGLGRSRYNRGQLLGYRGSEGTAAG